MGTPRLMPLHDPAADEDARAPAREIAGWCAVLSVAIGVLVLVGWWLDADVLTEVWPGRTAMKPNTAIMFLLAGVSLGTLTAARRRPGHRALTSASAAACVALGAATLLEYLVGGLGIDQLLFTDPVSGPAPGRPVPQTAVAFVLIGLTLLIAGRAGCRSRMSAQALNVGLALVVAAGLIGYAYRARYLYSVSGQGGIALHTLAGLVVLAVGLAALDPSRSWARIFVAQTPGGRMARHFAPLVVLGPILFSVPNHFSDDAVGRLISATVIVAATTAVLVRGASALDRAEAERRVLSGLLPICANCKSIRDDQGYWSQLEAYVETHSEAAFSHGLCPGCIRKLYPEVADRLLRSAPQVELSPEPPASA